MRVLSLISLLPLGSLAAVLATSSPDFTQPPIANVSNYPNGSLFYHWRPRAHFIHPSNQLGDPTAFWQAPDGTSHITALYSFLRGTGNASLSTSAFSGSTTKDFVQYEDLSGWQNPVQMGPGNEVDYIADFDGSVVASGYKGLPTLIWTAVKGLPISWTIPYVDGYESQGLAYSQNQGKTWIKLDGGANVPVIPRPPYKGGVVTGFRDPYIFRNAQFDSLLNVSSGEPMHYVTLSSGLHPAQPGLPGVSFEQAGPRVWLYKQSEPGNWLNWTFAGPLLRSTINDTFVTKGSGWAATDYSDGNNYECSQITNLDFDGDSSYEGTGLAYASYGAESNHTLMLYRLGHWDENAGIETTPVNASLADGVVGAKQGVEMQTALEGVLDWGLAYACTGLRDGASSPARRIVYCWIKEAFATQDATKFVTQYISSLTLPRELYVKRVDGVVNDELVRENASWAILDPSSSSNITTIPLTQFAGSTAANRSTVDLVMLGIKPAAELSAFRTNANDSYHHPALTLQPQDFNDNASCIASLNPELRTITAGDNATLIHELFIPLPRHPSSRHYELSTTITFPLSSLRNDTADFAAGISLLRTPQSSSTSEDVAVVYQPRNESVIVQKRTALGASSVLTTPEVGKLRLWNTTAGLEKLHLRLFVDGSALEVYINDRFVLTTRAYYWFADATRVGFVYQMPHNSTMRGEEWKVKFENTTWWEGLTEAYPNRPTDKEELIKQAMGYPEPENNPNAAGIIYNGTGPSPPFPNLG
uniref:Glycosyl hydrolase family 32 C-terminal domain-containing protein n=2 Tax=Kalmanozyma brasiliensis (strain GHG001) TaxID=1365824 RepID=V5EXI9_KALBG